MAAPEADHEEAKGAALGLAAERAAEAWAAWATVQPLVAGPTAVPATAEAPAVSDPDCEPSCAWADRLAGAAPPPAACSRTAALDDGEGVGAGLGGVEAACAFDVAASGVAGAGLAEAVASVTICAVVGAVVAPAVALWGDAALDDAAPDDAASADSVSGDVAGDANDVAVAVFAPVPSCATVKPEAATTAEVTDADAAGTAAGDASGVGGGMGVGVGVVTAAAVTAVEA